ncbi:MULTISPECIES: HDOD domain-containing protein [unclassified Thioalkalivibrio]|uniref:HDOD domain-containing protein n=1 Tax=unclassified Thioalkalivibrio TaxID=2621013 RepID=UPI0003670277|nr:MULTISPECIES: HDOD domain-containing protein [unclassified Thioalkalivibrio]
MSDETGFASLEARVEAADRLLAMPQVVFEVSRLLDDDESTQPQIAAALGRDPGLVAHVLRLANSPAYAPSRAVDSIERAVAMLGRDVLQRLVVASAVTRSMNTLPEQERLPLETFWRHSAYCAVIARQLAQAVAPRAAGVVFLAGLLHDLGKLLLFSQSPEAAHRAFLASLDTAQGPSPQAAEREQMGFDHARLGGALAERWGLPEALVEGIAWHHDPLSASDRHRPSVALVHLANTGAHLAEIDSRDWADAPPLEEQAWSIAGVSPEMLLQAVEDAQHEVLAVQALSDPEVGTPAG